MTDIDPRVEAAAKAMLTPKPNQIKYGEDLDEWLDRVMPEALAAADAADRAAGYIRVRVDDATVERVAQQLWQLRGLAASEQHNIGFKQAIRVALAESRIEERVAEVRKNWMQCMDEARAVLSALRGES